MTDPRRALPSVDRLLGDPDVQAVGQGTPRNLLVAAIRDALAEVRSGVMAPPDNWASEIKERVERRATPSLHRLLNATGVVLHTNLGRAPLAAAAIRAVTEVASGYSTLEYDLATGSRGSRSDHCASLLAALAGTEDALVVNNAAGALVLALNELAPGREVIISRGELIEIGGSFRIPDIMERSGAILREVGTTNRTRLGDYEKAISDRTGAILSVHRSNFEQRGFVESCPLPDLAILARARHLPLVADLGSGLLVDLTAFGLTGEPRVQDGVAAGADLVVFSGDKLLGGPQAGCLAGVRALVARCRKNPLARALRADKLTLSALEATLALYHSPEAAIRQVPVLAMLTLSPDELQTRAAKLVAYVPDTYHPTLLSGESAVGGGAFPNAMLPTVLVALDPGALGADGMALRLRLSRPPLVARVSEGRVLLDPRTLPEDSFAEVGRLLAAVAGG